ncbi:MAG: 2-phosphosulfolactate phosphatase [Candidatus Freyarchaeota archaeon]|nr:2-phosphosulfolactate phosphatase [Candidatus Jordarchaeia archaeon]
MIARLAFGPDGAFRAARKGHVVIVVDTLRASTTVTTILENGGRGVVPAATVEEAKEKARELSSSGGCVILAGERGGLKIPGFDYGNSPLEFTRKVVEEKIVVLTTTNFTRVVQQAADAPLILAGCLRNAEAVAGLARREALRSGRKITVVHSGRKGEFSPEDYVTACIIKCLIEGVAPPSHEECVLDSPSAKSLAALGLWEDVKYCSQLNVSATVPVMKSGAFVRGL